MNRIKEPKPRAAPKAWSPFVPAVTEWRSLAIPTDGPDRTFLNVLVSRSSAVGRALNFGPIADLLWHAVGTKGYAPAGRAGIPIEWRASPSGGALHPIHVVCVPTQLGDDVVLYDPREHRVGALAVDTPAMVLANEQAVTAVIGRQPFGYTLRFIADFGKTDAAYENAVSILLRDAGCLLMTICLTAEWLGLAACPLGFLGQSLCSPLGFPDDRFMGVGAIQLSSRN